MEENQDPLPVQNIYHSFTELGNRVHRALRTQLGDQARLNEEKHICLQFLEQINQVRETHQHVDHIFI